MMLEDSTNGLLESLKPKYPTLHQFYSLPLPSSPDAYCTLNAIRTGLVTDRPAFAFLIEKRIEGEVIRLLFESEQRPIEELVNPQLVELTDAWKAKYAQGAADILEKSGITLDSISALVLGHAHLNHNGSLTKLPSTVSLVVGPDSPIGQDLAKDMHVELNAVEEREVRQLARECENWEDVGCFKGVDYFGDGSLWLLDTPGHILGHITALVRTSTSPPVYHLLGSDMADVVTALVHTHIEEPDAGPFPSTLLGISAGLSTTTHSDLTSTYESMAKMQRMDSEHNISVFLAQDKSMNAALPPGNFVRLSGTDGELKKFKGRMTETSPTGVAPKFIPISTAGEI